MNLFRMPLKPASFDVGIAQTSYLTRMIRWKDSVAWHPW